MITEPLITKILEKFNDLTPEEFVSLIVEHLDRRSDYFDVQPGPPRGADKKVDIFAMMRSLTDVPRRVAFQCKRYRRSPLNSSAIHQTVEAILYKEADEGVIVSTSEPTMGAQEAILQWRRDGKVLQYEQWCGRGLVRNLVTNTPSVLIRYFPELRLLLPTGHEFGPLCPSFEIVIPIPSQDGTSADKFYDGHPPSWQNLAANHDIEREIYVKPGGIRDGIHELLNGPEGVHTVAFLGVAGTGKTALLRRLGFDIASRGYLVLRLLEDWLFTNSSLSKQIKDVVRVSDSPVLVLVDNAADLVFERNLFQATLRELETTKAVVVALSEQPDRWNSAIRRTSFLTQNENYSSYYVHNLLPSECESLVDRILKYEQDGTVSKVYCALSREERLDMCQGMADRQLLIAMIQMRHGASFQRIIQNEYERIPMAEAKEAYLLTCYFQTFNLPLPIDLLLRTLGIKSVLSVQEFEEASEGLLIETRLGANARHGTIARVVSEYGLTTSQSRKAALSTIVSNLRLEDESEQRIFLRLFAGQHSYRRLVSHFGRDVRLTRTFYSEIRAKHSSAGPNWLKFVASSQAMAERMLGFSNESRAYLQEAINLDAKYAYAYRQYAWLEHTEGNWDEAATKATTAAELAPENFLCNYHSGRILSLNTIENFYKAKRYLKFSLDMDPTDPRVQKTWDDYLAAEQMLTYLEGMNSDDLIPSYIYKELRPGLAFLRTVHGPRSNDFKRRLVGNLRHMEQETRGELADLYEKIAGVNDKGDSVLKALIACNIARLKYLEWYNDRGAQDLDEIEKLFRLSISLNQRDPFTHCWYGTFMKEARRDPIEADACYQKALSLGNQAKGEWMHDHPLFLNNISLLIVDEVQEGRRSKDALIHAKELLQKAIARVEKLDLDFYWAGHSLSLCEQLIIDLKVS
jgi:tetratricopeptide (TPR) repeat protein